MAKKKTAQDILDTIMKLLDDLAAYGGVAKNAAEGMKKYATMARKAADEKRELNETELGELNTWLESERARALASVQ